MTEPLSPENNVEDSKIKKHLKDLSSKKPPKKSRQSKDKEGFISSSATELAERRLKAKQKELKKEQVKLKAQKQLLSVAKGTRSVIDAGILDSLDDQDLKDYLATKTVAWQPHPGPQTWFLQANEDEVLFSGGRGRGASSALIADPLRYCENPRFKALIIRRTMPELRDLISNAKMLYAKAYPKVNWKEMEKTFFFPSGAKIEFGYCESIDDAMRYQGQEYCWLGVDEVTQYGDEKIIDSIIPSLRSPDATLPICVRLCVDEGDVLTVEGWKDIKDIVVGDKVHSLDKYGNSIIKTVYDTSSFDVDEELVRVKKENLYMSMTQDHRVMYETRHGTGDFRLIRWNEHTGKSIQIVRAPKYYNNVGYKGYTFKGMSAEDWISFIGIYLAEGCINQTVRNGNYKVVVTQLKKSSAILIRELLNKTGLKFCYCNNGDFQANSKELHTYLKQFGKSKDKFVPREILETATLEQLKILFNWLVLGDGTRHGDTHVTYFTTSPRLRDDFCELSVKLGYKVFVHNRYRENKKHNTCYNINVTIPQISPTTLVEKFRNNCKDISLQQYKGKVYCISVEDTENFIIRQKGYIWVSGNTCNPGGPGRNWVKERFVDKGPPNTQIKLTFNYGTEASPKLFTKTRRWIHSTVEDNPALGERYKAQLASITDSVRRAQWKDGDWDTGEGTAFPEFNKKTHVIEPFPIPNNWKKFRACDWGYSSLAVVLWLAVDNEQNVYVYREFVCNGKTPQRLTADKFASKVLELEHGEGVRYGYLDSSVWAHRGEMGETPADTMLRMGCSWIPSDRSPGSRIARKLVLHNYLATRDTIDSNGNIVKKPRIFIFSTCNQIIKELSSIILDKNNMEDVDTTQEEHAYDALTYGLASLPNPSIPFINFTSGDLAPMIVNTEIGM